MPQFIWPHCGRKSRYRDSIAKHSLSVCEKIPQVFPCLPAHLPGRLPDQNSTRRVWEHTIWCSYSKSKMVQPLYSEQCKKRYIVDTEDCAALYVNITDPWALSFRLVNRQICCTQRHRGKAPQSPAVWEAGTNLTLILWQTDSSVENKLFTSIAQLRSTCCNSTLQCRLKWDPSRRESCPEQRMLDGSVDKKVKLFTSIAQLRYAV